MTDRIRIPLAAVVLVASAAIDPGTAFSQTSGGRVANGELSADDSTLKSGEYYDEYVFEGRAGQRVTFDLTSPAFDTYLMVVSPTGEKKDSDDWERSNRRSRIDLALGETGVYRVLVTSAEVKETGTYQLRIVEDGSAAVPGVRAETGRLAAGDRTLQSGEYYDEFTTEGRRGEIVTFDLRSSQFDPYLIVVDPNDKRTENDDYEGDPSRALVSLELPADGEYRVLVTSYEKGETGSYDLGIQRGAQAGAQAAAAPRGPRIERGRLSNDDQTLRSGEYVDSYTFEGRPGERVVIDVASDDFDTYLILIPPRGERQENDDIEGRPNHSVIDADVRESGTYRVLVTSYENGESGSYELRIDLGSAEQPSADRPRDAVAISYDQTAEGRLSPGDARLESGEYRDIYTFEGQSGDRIVLELASREFDPYLSLKPPAGEQIDNDDADGRQDLSRIELTLREGGRYRVAVTSYESGMTGGYRLTLRRASGLPSVARPPAGPHARRVFGIFVGIADYPGTDNDLRYTADDARHMQQTLPPAAGMAPRDVTLLVNGQATVANLRRAVQTVAREATADDMFVFFYSGHGGRTSHTGPPQPADPDGQDETLALHDGDVTDDEMSAWMSGVHAAVSLIVLDSCFSGGFSKDVISVPGRMGVFSSEEDVTSSVAAKFRAGGYLAPFIVEAVGNGLADEDRDGSITALELSQYLHERFRSDVKGGGEGDFVRTGGPQSGYQHLVVDRGSVGPFDVLFRR
jgi:hypothetical protein